MTKYFGQYLKRSETDKWHWMNKCPDYPVNSRIISMITSSPLSETDACFKCIQLEAEKHVIEEKKE